ncbi:MULTISPECIES: helix-turn-helix domain-containing protein [Paenibacillus]|uniref:helix-turn-helix domain-containing protein n=1 Tax=Paenibacillus TaxID=44249 RepID=UPI00040A8828|nr:MULTISPECIES: hypothetical protein [Paenibacillus]KGP77465.1 hypothetical protein P363_0133330 [Paenibacillus sp. MAEPY1]KGP78420.1 hypothetical protein P364_0128685 [Paenibacillus sp. MAEPY2]
MEKEDIKLSIDEIEFMNLVQRSRKGDQAAFMAILDMFEEEMEQMAKYIRMPKEDVMQSLRLGLLELIINHTTDNNPKNE